MSWASATPSSTSSLRSRTSCCAPRTWRRAAHAAGGRGAGPRAPWRSRLAARSLGRFGGQYGRRRRRVGRPRELHRPSCATTLGRTFARDIRARGVSFDTPPARDGPPTGHCLVLVTPDAQRTLCAHLGASLGLAAADIDRSLVGRSRVVFLEGYLLDAPAGRGDLRGRGAGGGLGRHGGRRVALRSAMRGAPPGGIPGLRPRERRHVVRERGPRPPRSTASRASTRRPRAQARMSPSRY